ncbi:MAG: hypothetical protein FJ212_08685 [Ignavibacteria bacterium]|nr:hypothetical protein [Ignavibacteria bacterium]MBM4174411.1 hypothetical protein [Ignavibacteria bacterium]
MENTIIAAQLVVGVSVLFVWIFRYDNIIKEFKQFGLSDFMRSFVGASKIALATLLLAGIWYPSFVQISSILMGIFMISAQFYHFRAHNPFLKRLPSLIFLIMCFFIAYSTMDL